METKQKLKTFISLTLLAVIMGIGCLIIIDMTKDETCEVGDK